MEKTGFWKFSKNSKKSQKNPRDLNLVSKDAHQQGESIGMQHVQQKPISIRLWGEKPLLTPKKGEKSTQKSILQENASINFV